MATTALTNALILANGYNVSGYSNTVSLQASADELESTVFGSTGARTFVGGLKAVEAEVSGYWDATPDSQAMAALSATSGTLTIAPTPTAGGPCYFMQASQLAYSHSGDVGALYDFTLGATARDAYGLVRGALLHDPATARTSSGSGSAVQLTAASSSQRLHVALHVLSASGTTPSLTVVVQRDNNSGFSSPATAHTFSAATAIGSEYASVAGPITDDYYRLSWTISGTSPSFTFCVSAGIA